MNDYRDIPALLHDSKLIGLDWKPALNLVSLSCECLRRSAGGTSIHDPVELLLEGVEQMGAYYDPPHIEVRPSEFVVTDPIRESELGDWQRQPSEVSLAVNSAHADFLMGVSCVRHWFAGEPPLKISGTGKTPLRIHLTFDNHSYGKQAVANHLFIGCDSIRIMSSGVPLSVDEWRHQFEAWWHGWEEHWANKEVENAGEDQPLVEDTFIPAGESDDVDLSYRPPSKPVFQLSKTDAPDELLDPLCRFHLGLMEKDWEKMATAYPDLDQSDEVRAMVLKDRYLVHEFGRWVYLRQVDEWWIEGQTACVVVRGIEHTMPDEEDPASNEETVLAYRLLQYEDRWIISTWSQGWPRYGSAPALDQPASWKSEWKSAH